MADNDLDFLEQAPIANIVNENDVSLSDSEKDLIIATWNSGATSLKEIIQKACGPEIDGRSKKGIAVKDFLASRNLKARPAQVYSKKTDALQLTDSQKEFIANNATNMKIMEMTKTIFDNINLGSFSTEFRVVKDYYDGLDASVKTADNDDIDIKEYNPPRIEIQAIARINKYVLGGIDTESVTPKQRECVQKLIRYMHTFRFLFEMKNLSKKSEREMFESSFVRYCWDKPDLTEEDIDLYLNLCSEQILYERMKKELIFLTEQRDIEMQSHDGQAGRLPMAIVESIGKLRGDLDASSKKQEKTLQGLNGRRDKRIEKLNGENLSLLSLVEAVRDADKRRRIAEVFEIRNSKVKQEAERLEELGEDVFEIFGATKMELT